MTLAIDITDGHGLSNNARRELLLKKLLLPSSLLTIQIILWMALHTILCIVVLITEFKYNLK